MPDAPLTPHAGPGPRSRRWATLLLVLALGAGLGWELGRSHAPAPAVAELSADFQRAEARVAPAVVKIQVESPRRAERHHGLQLPPGLQPPPELSPQEHSLGSGLILDPGGYIVTNRHVVNHASEIQVSVPGDAHVYFARLIGQDADTDLAVIKIDAPHPLAAAHLGNSQRLGVGDWVMAIGAPFGLESTVTAGIVSALHRGVDPGHQFESFIQTDAPINPGNSGGPLINLAGQVVGINTAIYTDGEGYQGVGFALPSELVDRIYPQLRYRGRVVRGSIGVYFESHVDAAARRVYHLERGVPLSQVVAGGPAAAAGLRAGDVITSVDGAAVSDGAALMQAIVYVPVGRQVQLGYRRGKALMHALVQVTDRSALYPQPAGDETPPAAPAPPDLGMSLKAAAKGAGVLVTGVAPDSLADRMGVRRGDVVIEIDRQSVHAVADVQRWAAGLRTGEDVAMMVLRPNGDGSQGQWLLGGEVPPSAADQSSAPERAKAGAPRRAGARPGPGGERQ